MKRFFGLIFLAPAAFAQAPQYGYYPNGQHQAVAYGEGMDFEAVVQAYACDCAAGKVPEGTLAVRKGTEYIISMNDCGEPTIFGSAGDSSHMVIENGLATIYDLEGSTTIENPPAITYICAKKDGEAWVTEWYQASAGVAPDPTPITCR